jgi:Spy/CpxP family protein refolding chaperone
MKDVNAMMGGWTRGMRKLGAPVALVLALAMASQGEPGGMRGGPGGPGGMGGAGGPGVGAMDFNPRMLRELSLSPDQEKKLKDTRLAAEKRKIQLHGEKAIIELDLKNVLGTHPVNKAEALKLAEKIADVDKKLLLLKVETMSQLMAGLTAEQHAKLMILQEEWKEKRKAWKEEMRKERMDGKEMKGGKDGH